MHINILIHSSRGDSHNHVDLVGVWPTQSGWRDNASTLPLVKQDKRGENIATGMSQGFDLIPFGFSSFRTLGRVAEEVISQKF